MADKGQHHSLFVRDYADGDAPAVARFWNESADSWPAGFSNGVGLSADRIRAGFRTGSSINLYLAFERVGDDERLIGYCNLTRAFDQDPSAAYVALLNVHPAALSHGVGKMLLRRALDRTIELGYRRLDLHTWPGNVRAVPLYKKMGFFWVPDTSVRMENFLPAILGHPLTKRFLDGADWYECFRRELTQAPDTQSLDGRPVYLYDFERGGQKLRWAIDVATREPVAVECGDLFVSLRAPTKLAVGASATATVRLTDGASRPYAVFCRAESGVAGASRAAGDALPAGEIELTLTAKEIGSKGRVAAEVAIGGEIVSLGAGVAVTPRVSLRLEPTPPLRPGIGGELQLTAANDTADPVRGVIMFVPTDGLDVEPREVHLELGPEERQTLNLRATGTSGVHEIAYRVLAGSESATESPIQRLSLAIVEAGDVAAWSEGPGGILETARLRYTAEPSGTVRITDRETGQVIVSPSVVIGPPYTPLDPAPRGWVARVESAGGHGQLVLTSSMLGRPLEVSLVLDVTGGDQITETVRVRNLGAEPLSANARLVMNLAVRPAWREAVTVPLRAGLVSSSWPEFPDWYHLTMSTAEYAEGWISVAYADRAIGLAWREAVGVDWNWGGPHLEVPIGEVPAGGAASASPVLLALGSRDWRDVRRAWRDAFAPSASATTPEPAGVVDVLCRPELSSGELAIASLSLRSFLARSQSGWIELQAPSGWRIANPGLSVENLRLANGFECRVEAEPPSDGPAAAVARGVFVSNLGEWPVAVPLIRLGRGEARPEVRAELESDQEVVRIDNGWWSFAVAPAFSGAVTSLVRQGVEQLSSAFPNARNKGWGYPWYGGIVPVLRGAEAGPSRPGDSGSFFREAPRWEALYEEMHLGARWSGIRLSGESKAWSGVDGEVDYLMSPGSNSLLVRCRLRNGSRARVRGAFDLTAYLAPGGSVDATEIHTINERGKHEVLRRAPYRTFSVSSVGWAAASDPATGATVCLVGLDRDDRVYGLDLGRDGGHLGLWADLDLSPAESIRLSGLIFLAPDPTGAETYRWLAGSG